MGVWEEAAGQASGLRGWESRRSAFDRESFEQSSSNTPHVGLCDSVTMLSVSTLCQRKVAGCNKLIMPEVPVAGSPGVKHLPSARPMPSVSIKNV